MSVRPNLLVIRVAEMGASRIFYGALGRDLKVEKHGAGPEHLSYAKNGFVFEICPRLRSNLRDDGPRSG